MEDKCNIFIFLTMFLAQHFVEDTFFTLSYDKLKSFSLYSDCRWNGFYKSEELGKQLSFAIIYINFFFYKSNFIEQNP